MLVDCRVVRERLDVGHVAAEIEEIYVPSRGVPVDFLEGVGWVVEWTADWEGNCLGKVADVYKRAETEYVFEFRDSIVLL